MEYTVTSPLMLFKYFEEVDESVPIPASYKQVDEFNQFCKGEDLAQYVDEKLKDIITSITFEAVQVDRWSKNLPSNVDLVANVKTTRELTEKEQNKVMGYLEGQYSDGWLENGFELRNGGMFQAFWDYYGKESELTMHPA